MDQLVQDLQACTKLLERRSLLHGVEYCVDFVLVLHKNIINSLSKSNLYFMITIYAIRAPQKYHD